MDLKPLEVKSDYRGSLAEAFELPSDGLVFYIVVKPGESRGNHYHLRKIEHFLVIWGSATISVKDRSSGDVIKVETSGFKPMDVKVVPNHTHSITASEEGCICLVWVNEKYNSKDPDTYPEEI